MMAKTSTKSQETFLLALRHSGLVEAERIDEQMTDWRPGSAEVDTGKELARRFVTAGLLTPFQAGCLLKGQWQGLTVAGKYQLLGVLGIGGMGQVYLAEHALMR